MYIAMNRFKVALGREDEFEQIWRERESFLGEVTGFRQFSLLRAASNEEHTLFATHVEWEDEAAFRDWTRSEAFRKAHGKTGGGREGLYLGHPCFEGFEVLYSEP